MEIREVTLKEKISLPNASYVIITNNEKKYFTKNAMLELQSKLNNLLICSVVKSVKENTKPTFTEWIEQNGYYEKGLEWFNKHGYQRRYIELIEMHKEECRL